MEGWLSGLNSAVRGAASWNESDSYESQNDTDRSHKSIPLIVCCLGLVFRLDKKATPKSGGLFTISANAPEVITSLRVFRILAQQTELAGCGKRYAR